MAAGRTFHRGSASITRAPLSLAIRTFILPKIILAALVAFLTLTGCAGANKMMGMPYNEGHGYKIEHVEKSRYIGGITIEYEHENFLAERNANVADLTMSSPKTPTFSGGHIVVRLDGSSLEAAKASHLELILVRDGEEVVRKTGSSSTPNVPGSMPTWWSVSVVPVQEPLDSGYLDLYVVHKVHQQRDHFRIYSQD